MENTSKNFVLQLGSLVSLYISLGALVVVVFGIINIVFPDAAESYWEYESAQSSVRFGIAMLVVFFPTYIILTRLVNTIRRTEHGVYLTLTRWLIYLSLFIGTLILLGDLVAVLWSFLNGEVTARFLLKAGTLLVVVGAALYYYILDARGYWNKHESSSKLYAAIASTAVIALTVAGFLHIDPPAEVRAYRMDQQQVYDLQDMQYRIEEHYHVNEELPEEMDGLYAGTALPMAPEGREEYEYRTMDATHYELCATFAQPTTRADASIARPMFDKEFIEGNYNWDHDAGRTCFKRVVAPLEE